MNVLSLFDGMSCGQVALERAGIKYDRYHASEIELPPIRVTQARYPATIQVGDVNNIRREGNNIVAGDYFDENNKIVLPKIDLLMGGSPCFVGTTRVLTENGYKYISEVEVGDMVLTHKNRFRKVVRTGNQVKPTKILHAQGIRPTEVTANHPYYVRTSYSEWNPKRRMDERKFTDVKWKSVGELQERDFIGIPILKGNQFDISVNAKVIDGIVWYPIRKVEDGSTSETVYNLEVEEDNSYTANNAIVHNCQGFSFSGKQLNFDDPRSKLFFKFVDILHELKPKYFFLENVVMKMEHRKVITQFLECSPVKINSKLVSAQDRKRLYWTNIPAFGQPADVGKSIRDIMETNVEERYFIKGPIADRWKKGQSMEHYEAHYKNGKVNKSVVIGQLSKYQGDRIFLTDGKASSLSAQGGNNGGGSCNIIIDNDRLRRLTPVECERLQTIKDNYTVAESDFERYKMLGNGWTVDVIKHFFSHIV